MTHGALGGLGLLVLIFGFAPGMVLAAIVRLIPDVDRRRELQAELYEVPRWDRPFWVAQQFEVAIRIGLSPQLAWYWGRYVWHRARIESGLENHRRYPQLVLGAERRGEGRVAAWRHGSLDVVRETVRGRRGADVGQDHPTGR